MPFVRSRDLRPTVAAVAAVAAVLMTTTVVPALAEQPQQREQAPQADTVAAVALPVSHGPDPSVFCPRPTGRWWEDYAARGCVELLGDRTDGVPVSGDVLAWLDLGDLPAHATVDVTAIGAALADHELRLLAEREAREREAEALERERRRVAAQAAERAAAAERRAAPPAPRSVAHLPVPDFDQLEAMMVECGLSLDGDHGFLGEHPCIADLWTRIVGGERGLDTAPRGAAPRVPAPTAEDRRADLINETHQACLTRVPTGTPDGDIVGAPWPVSDAYFDAVAACVDERVPGYLAEWTAFETQRRAAREVSYQRELEALARLEERKQRALQQIRETCPSGGSAVPTKMMVSSWDEIEYEVVCNE